MHLLVNWRTLLLLLLFIACYCCYYTVLMFIYFFYFFNVSAVFFSVSATVTPSFTFSFRSLSLSNASFTHTHSGRYGEDDLFLLFTIIVVKKNGVCGVLLSLFAGLAGGGFA